MLKMKKIFSMVLTGLILVGCNGSSEKGVEDITNEQKAIPKEKLAINHPEVADSIQKQEQIRKMGSEIGSGEEFDLKSEVNSPDFWGDIETYYSDIKLVKGIPMAHNITTKVGSQPVSDVMITNFKFNQKVVDSIFNKPEPENID